MVTTPNSRLLGFVSMTAGLILLVVPPSSARGASVEPLLAPDLAGLGTLHFQVSTSSPRAQQLFDQGLRLLYAFDDREALRTFLEAAHRRSDSGDGPLGSGYGPRTEPQVSTDRRS
jgi:hypothetical protein